MKPDPLSSDPNTTWHPKGGPLEYGMVSMPTWKQRFWGKLGFRYQLGEEPIGADQLIGWSRTDIRLSFSLLDRLRLLLTGRLYVGLVSHFDTPSPWVVKNRIDLRILYPGSDW